MASLTYGMATDTGRTRKTNQDAVFAGKSNDTKSEMDIFIVVDGMGAELEGQQAAQLVITTISQFLQAQSFTNASAILNALTEAYQQATAAIQQQQLDAGASATTVYIKDSIAYIAHVGCTRAYAVAAHDLDRLTTDHTMEERSIELGLDFTGDPYAPVLYRAIGQSDEAPDTLIHPLTEGSGILLLSDGVYRAGAQFMQMGVVERVVLPLDDETLLNMIRQADDEQVACDALLVEANRRSGSDNASAVLVTNGFVFGAEAE